MNSSIEIVVDAVDADRAAAFWKEALGYEFQSESGAYTSLRPPEGDPRPRLVIQRVDVVTPGKTSEWTTRMLRSRGSRGSALASRGA